MINIGQFNSLKVIKEVPFGVYLDGKEWGDILLPKKVVPPHCKLQSQIEVFIYFDSEDKIIATTKKPYAQVGTFAYLKVIDINQVGAFLDWGLDKDLLVPRVEQQRPMEENKSYIVYIKQDSKNRISASSKLDYFLDKSPAPFGLKEEVSLLIAETTSLGTKVIINDSHWGLIHTNDIFQALSYGKRTWGFIKTIRDDGKIDVILRKVGVENIQDLATRLLAKLHAEGGFLPLHDKSSAEEVKHVLSESKKSFKNAIGRLYKQGEITIETNGIRLKSKVKVNNG